MRAFIHAALAASGLCLASCTLDYDGFGIAGEGGGAATSASTSTAASSVQTTGASTSDVGSTSGGGEGGATSSSSGAGAGGDGQGGVADILPCPGLALSFEPSNLDDALEGSAWMADETGGGNLDTDFDRLAISVDGNGSDDAETAEIRTVDAELFACSVTLEFHQFDAAGTMDFPAVAYLSAVGDWGGEGEDYEGIEIVVSPEEECEIGSRLRGDVDWDGDSTACELPTPGVLLRLTHTGQELCHEVSHDGGTLFETLHCRPTTVAHRVALGATTVEDVEFFFGRIN